MTGPEHEAGPTTAGSPPARQQPEQILVLASDTGVGSVHTAVVARLRELRSDLVVDGPHDLDDVRRVLADHPDALQGYALAVTIAPGTGRPRAAASMRRLTDLLAERLPTIAVEAAPDSGGASSAAEPDDEVEPSAGPVRVLVVPAEQSSERVAGVVVVAAQAELLRLRRERLREGVAARTTRQHVVDELAARRLQKLVLVAQDAFEFTGAAVNLAGDSTMDTVVAAGGGTGQHPLDDSLCQVTLRRRTGTVIADTWSDAATRSLTPVQGSGAVRFYAGYPLLADDGSVLGTLCVYDVVPHDPEEYDFELLRDLALLAEGELADARLRAGHEERSVC